MRVKKKELIKNLLFIIFIILLLAITIGMNKYPEQTSKLLGYRFYVVLTDSMEPKIPTHSLVFTKMLNEDEAIEPNSIVTFRANRMGENVLLTHYYRETQEKDGQVFYRTQGATAPRYDDYETKRSDIIGTYGFHVPYVGKVILIFQSPFGFMLLAEWTVIWLINKTILALWEEKDKKRLQQI